MKRYKEYTIFCKEGQHVSELLGEIQVMSLEKGYETTVRDTFINGDTLYANFNVVGYPDSRIVLSANNRDGGSVRLCNVIPTRSSGHDSLSYDDYNAIVDKYIADVLDPVRICGGNQYEETQSDYEVEDIIPSSFSKLESWIKGSPLSFHPNDILRWNEFLVSLRLNGEHLSFEDFSKYLRENAVWDDEDYSIFERKYEDESKLLEYYDTARNQ